jgi:hypothetical protein
MLTSEQFDRTLELALQLTGIKGSERHRELLRHSEQGRYYPLPPRLLRKNQKKALPQAPNRLRFRSDAICQDFAKRVETRACQRLLRYVGRRQW